MVGLVAIALMLGGVFSFLLPRQGRDWSSRRASTRVRSATGPNFASILAVVGIAEILLKVGELVPVGPAGPILAVLAVALLVGIVVVGEPGRLVVGLLGIALTFIALGVNAAIALLVVVGLLVWLLGALRGWLS